MSPLRRALLLSKLVPPLVNSTGAALTFLYFHFVDPRAGRGRVPVAEALPVFLGLLAGAVLVGFLWNRRALGPAWRYARRVLAGETAPPSPREQRAIIGHATQNAVVAFAMWVLVGAVLTSLDRRLHTFLAVVGVGGVFTAALAYLLIDTAWRPAVAALLPDGEIAKLRVRRVPTAARLLVAFALVGIWPAAILVAVSLHEARLLATAVDPAAVHARLVIIDTFLLATTLVTIVGLTLLVTRGIVHPLRDLERAMARVAAGDLGARVAVTSNDELGYLAESFNRMTAGLREGEMLRTLFGLYVTPEVAREALRSGARLGGAEVRCTVLFSDIRGFTSLSERLAPGELIALLNRYMGAMVEVVVAHGGMVNKFGGDSLLAVFGTPLNPAADHAARAVATAAAMGEALERFNREQGDGPKLRIGIGLATGPVVAGNVGGEQRLEYTVIGDTVNLASRLQSLTKEVGKDVLAAGATVDEARGHRDVAAVELEPLPVRGKAEPVRVYAL